MLPADLGVATAPEPLGNGPAIRLREGRPPSDRASDAKRPRLLLIDDCIFDDSPEVVALRLEGFDVTAVQTGEAGLLLLERETFDLVVVDLAMPGMSGIEVLAELSRRQYGVPAVMLTGYGSIASATAAMKLGAADFLEKPVWIEELMAHVQDALTRHPRGGKLMAPTEADLVRTRAALILECVTCDAAAATVLRLLLDERISLRYFHGLAGALRLLVTSADPTSAIVLERAHLVATEGLTAPWPDDPRLLQRFTRLESDPKAQADLGFAALFGLSRAYLSRRLKKATGHGPTEWRRASPLRAALRALVRTTEQVSIIAHAVGYEYVSQFDREFLATFGIQPVALRRRFASLYKALSTQS